MLGPNAYRRPAAYDTLQDDDGQDSEGELDVELLLNRQLVRGVTRYLLVPGS